MFYVLQNESTAARRRVPILLTDAATGTTAQTGVATTTIFPYVNINGNAFIGGTGNVGEAGFGQYYYEFEVNEVATLGLAGIHITAAGCRDYDAIAQIAAFDLYSASAGGGISAYDVWQYPIPLSGQSAEDTLGNAANASSSAESQATTAANQTVNISDQVWATDLSSYVGTNYAGDYLLQLGTGATGYASVGLTAGDVWDYASRTITGGIADTVQLVATPVEISYPSMAGLANTIWSTDISGYTSPSAGFDLSNASSGSGISAHDVWDFVITGFGQTGSAALYTTQTNFTVGNIESYVQTQTPQDVWTYAGVEGRTITGGTATTVTNPVLVSPASMTGIAGTVWNYGTRTLTSGGGITAGDVSNAVWNVPVSSYSTNGTFGLNVLRADQANKVGDVTLYSSGGVNGVDADVHRIANDTGAATAWKNILTGIGSSITSNITGNITGNLSGSVGSVSGAVGSVTGSVGSVTSAVSVATASMTGIAGTVWTNATRTITGGIADTVTTLTNRSGFAITGGTITTVSDKTGYSLSGSQTFNMTGNITGNVSGSVGSVTNAVSLATASMTGIAGTVWATNISGYTSPSAGYSLFNATAGGGITAGDVWSYATRTLTSGGSGISAFDVWNFVLSDANTAEVDLVQAASGSGLTVGDVWNAPSRTITGGIANTVSTVTNGVIVTTNNDKTGYSLSGPGVSAVQSGLSTLTQAQVGTEVDSSLSDVGLTTTVTGRIDATVSSRLASASYVAPPTEAAIAGTVWGYNSRTLTSGAGATAGDVWAYPTRSLTSGAGITVNAATNIINGPYFVKSNVDGQDGTLDVIRGMVQDIQLTVTDAFQNPFDTTALGLAVNFYDQAGTLVTSYGTTELYGPAGLVQFTLDQVVTANEGRYNLILSAAGSGNTIKFGPLQTLVRPY